MSSIDFKKRVEAQYRTIDDEFWQRVTTEGPGQALCISGNVEGMVALICVAEAAEAAEKKAEAAEKKAEAAEKKAEAAEKKAEAAEAEKERIVEEKERIVAEKERIVAEKEKLVAENQTLKQQQQTKVEIGNQWFVFSVSDAAQKNAPRNFFRKIQVGNDPCEGGFVCHEMFIEFVKASHLMYDGTDSTTTFNRDEELTTFIAVEEELNRHMGRVLLSDGRSNDSLFLDEYVDEEAPQSALAANMFQFALERLKQKQSIGKEESDNQLSISVTHQFSIVCAVDQEKLHQLDPEKNKKRKMTSVTESLSKERMPSLSETSEVLSVAEAGKEKRKSTMPIDILFWFIDHTDSWKSSCLAAVAYKPNDSTMEERKAQADMYASNIQIQHKKPCLSIDISGGNDVSKWSISVYALAFRPARIRQVSKNYHWDKSPLYEGTGVSAFVRVAAGLLACLPFFPKNTSDDFGKRLGPCVGVVGDKVFKAFDNDKTKTRRSNIDIIQTLFDATRFYGNRKTTGWRLLKWLTKKAVGIQS